MMANPDQRNQMVEATLGLEERICAATARIEEDIDDWVAEHREYDNG